MSQYDSEYGQVSGETDFVLAQTILPWDEEKWNAEVFNVKGNVAYVRLQVPVNAPVGRFDLDILIQQKEKEYIHHESQIYILFNPWHKCKYNNIHLTVFLITSEKFS